MRVDSGEFDALEPGVKSAPVKIGDVVLFTAGPLVDRKCVVMSRHNGHQYRVEVGNLMVTARAKQLEPVRGEGT
jgi:hypothetical protein